MFRAFFFYLYLPSSISLRNLSLLLAKSWWEVRPWLQGLVRRPLLLSEITVELKPVFWKDFCHVRAYRHNVFCRLMESLCQWLTRLGVCFRSGGKIVWSQVLTWRILNSSCWARSALVSPRSWKRGGAPYTRMATRVIVEITLTLNLDLPFVRSTTNNYLAKRSPALISDLGESSKCSLLREVASAFEGLLGADLRWLRGVQILGQVLAHSRRTSVPQLNSRWISLWPRETSTLTSA